MRPIARRTRCAWCALPGGDAASILATYPVSAYASPQLAWDAAVTDLGACATQHVNQILAPQTQYYAYEFDERTAPFYFPKMPGFVSLAYHTSDIQYLFPLYHGGSDGIIHSLNNKQEDLSDQLVAAWTNFAWTGNPTASAITLGRTTLPARRTRLTSCRRTSRVSRRLRTPNTLQTTSARSGAAFCPTLMARPTKARYAASLSGERR